jgi:hypothetical protein
MQPDRLIDFSPSEESSARLGSAKRLFDIDFVFVGLFFRGKPPRRK